MVAGTAAPRVSGPMGLYSGFVLFSILGLAATHFAHIDAGVIGRLASAATILSGCAVFVEGYLQIGGGRRRIIAVSGLFVLFAAIEYAGIITGFPFGRYSYTDRWWPAAPLPNAGFYPLLVPFAWLMVTGASYLLTATYAGWKRVVFAAVMATAMDLSMESVMTSRLGYWKWIDQGPLPGKAPLSNSAAWLALGLVASCVLLMGEPRLTKSGKRFEAGLWGLIVLGGQVLVVASLSLF